MVRMRLNLGQKQSIVTSLSAAVAAFLIIILITLALFIFVRGGHYFWPQDIQKIVYQSPQNEQPVAIYAVPTAETMRVDQALLHFRYSSNTQLFNGQITLNQDYIAQTTPADEASAVALKNGGIVIGKLLYLTDEMGQKVDVDKFDFIQLAAASFSQQIDYIRNNELAYIHNQLAEMDRKGVDEGKELPTVSAAEGEP